MIDRRVRPSRRRSGPLPEQRLHAQRLAAALEQRRVAVPQAVELGDEIAADAARRVHALRQVGELGVLVLEQMDEVGQRHFLAEAPAEDAQRHRQRARLLLVRGRVLQVQHVAERRRRQVGEQLLLVLGQLVDAVGQQRDRDRPARGAARRVDGDVDGVGELLALAAPLAEFVVDARATRRDWRRSTDRPCGRSAPPACRAAAAAR